MRPKSEIYTPKRDDEHPSPFYVGVPHPGPRGSKRVAAAQYKVLTQGMDKPEYMEKCRQITDVCGWPEGAKDMAPRNAIFLGLKNPNVYQKCLEENQDTLTADRVIEIGTDKGPLWRLSVRRQQPSEPYSKAQVKFTR